MRPEVPIDLPGSYGYRLTVNGRGGVSRDEVTITAQPIVSSVATLFYVTPSTTAAGAMFQLPITVHPSYTGAPLPLTISSDANWLTIDTPNVTTATTSVTVRLDRAVLETLATGSHQGVVRIQPATYAAWSGTFTLNFQLPSVTEVSPYVVYAGQQTSVNLLGDQLQLAPLRVYVDNAPAHVTTRFNTSKARVELPALAAGEYTLRVRNELGIERPSVRLVVRDVPEHPDGDVRLPGVP